MSDVPLRERQRRLREEAILDAAHTLLAEHGYSAMSMDDVAAAVGISKATLYQHFLSKEELGTHVVARSIRRIEALIGKQDATARGVDRLEEVMRAVVENRFGGKRADLQTMEPTAMPTLRNHPLVQEPRQRVEQAIMVLVDQAKREGDIAPQLATPVVVRGLFGCMLNAEYLTLLATGQCTLEELKTTLIHMMFQGLRHRPMADG